MPISAQEFFLLKKYKNAFFLGKQFPIFKNWNVKLGIIIDT